MHVDIEKAAARGGLLRCLGAPGTVICSCGNWGLRQPWVAWESAGHLERAPCALWGIELGGDPLRAVADHLLSALRANGYTATALAHASGDDAPFYLDELSGLRLALILMAVKPLARHERIEAIGQGVQRMSAEEAYYWFSKCSAGADALRAQKALRILLAKE